MPNTSAATRERKRHMKNWLINLIAVTLGCVISLPLMRHATIKPLPWKFCIEWCALMWGISGPIFIAIGALADLENKRKERP